MSPTRRAVIDVGTNSVKLLVADVRGHDVEPVLEESRQTRLGRGFYETHLLRQESIDITAGVVAVFAEEALKLKAESVRVIATSAARDAKNPQDLISAIQTASGLKVEIISGEQEADWAFKGVMSDSDLSSEPLLLLDVGGGSTEFILGQGDKKHFSRSFPIGTVRWLEKNPHSDPPKPRELAACRQSVRDFLVQQVKPLLETSLQREGRIDPEERDVQLVGTGGTATILARMEAKIEDFDRELIESTPISLTRMRWHVENLWSLPLAKRQEIVGLPKKRADVILMGTVIYETVMEVFGLQELRVTTRGLRYAVLMDGA